MNNITVEVGWNFYEVGNLQKALESFDIAIKEDSKNAEAFFGRGVIKATLGDLEKDRGEAENANAKYKEALLDYNKAIELAPLESHYISKRGWLYRCLEDAPAGIADTTAALKLNPENADAYNIRGAIKTDLLGNYEEALLDFNNAIRISPDFVDALFSRGITENYLEKFEEAINDFSEVIKLNPFNSSAYCSRGSSKYKLGLKDEALKDYEKALELDPQDSLAYYNIFEIRYADYDYEEAIKIINKAIAIKPFDPDFFYGRGITKVQLRDAKGAIEDFNQTIKLKPHYANAYLERGMAKFSPEILDLEGARQDIEKYLEFNTENGEAYYFLGLIYQDLNENEKSLQYLQQAEELGYVG